MHVSNPHLALGERPVGAHHKQHKVGARHKLFRQALLALEDDVGAWRVHDAHVPQQLFRAELRVESKVSEARPGLRTVLAPRGNHRFEIGG